MSDAPEKIWATVNGASTRLPDGGRQLLGGWSEDAGRPRAVGYVRADLHAALTEERDRLALANAELLAGLEPFAKVADQLHPGKYGPAWGFNKAIIEHEDFQKARALLTKHKATSTEREGE